MMKKDVARTWGDQGRKNWKPSRNLKGMAARWKWTCMHAKSLQSCPTLCNPTDCSPPRSSVHGIHQAKILQWVAMPFSRGSASFFTACIPRMVTQRWPKFQFQYVQMKFYCIPTIFVHLPAISGCFCTRAGKSNRYSRGQMACRAPNTCCLVLYKTVCWSLPWKILSTKKNELDEICLDESTPHSICKKISPLHPFF